MLLCMMRVLLCLALCHGAMAAFEQPDVDGLPELFVWRGTCNSYVLRHGSEALVIDPGDGEYVAELGKLGIKQVSMVLLTDPAGLIQRYEQGALRTLDGKHYGQWFDFLVKGE
jgi:hypothetical protein